MPIERYSARYGYISRSTEELNDRENGILGSDLIVMDFETEEVLGVRRSFGRYEVDERTKDTLVFWSYSCKESKLGNGLEFLKRVLKPKSAH